MCLWGLGLIGFGGLGVLCLVWGHFGLLGFRDLGAFWGLGFRDLAFRVEGAFQGSGFRA